jgi:hypothetical protein
MSSGGFRDGTDIPEGDPILWSEGKDDRAWMETLALPCLEGKQR